MARVHGKDLSSLSVDDAGGTARNLLNETIGVDFSTSADTHDTTTMGDDWKEFTAGLKGGDTFTHEVFYNNVATTGTAAVYRGRVGVAGSFSFSDGTLTASMETIVTNVSESYSVADMIKITATHQVTGAVTFN